MKQKHPKHEPPMECPECGVVDYGALDVKVNPKEKRGPLVLLMREVCNECDATKRYWDWGFKREFRVMKLKRKGKV